MSPISNILGLTIDRARSFFEVVVLLILLTWWQQLPEPESPHQVIEFYAGVGRIAALAQYTGYKSVAGVQATHGHQFKCWSDVAGCWFSDSRFVFPLTLEQLDIFFPNAERRVLV